VNEAFTVDVSSRRLSTARSERDDVGRAVGARLSAV